MWGSERQGAFSNALSASHGRSDPERVTCFCQFCQAKAKQSGINVDRARTGFLELAKFVSAGRAHERPVDGYYVTLWRLMLPLPGIVGLGNACGPTACVKPMRRFTRRSNR